MTSDQKASPVDRYLAELGGFRSSSADLPGWAEDLSREASSTFERIGFPGPKEEEWRYTSASAITGNAFEAPRLDAASGVSASDVARFSYGVSDWPTMVFVDGFYRPQLSSAMDVPGVRALGLRTALQQYPDALSSRLGKLAPASFHGFAACNTAVLQDGAFIDIAEKAELAQPIHLLFIATGTGKMCFPRILLRAGAMSTATVIESYVSVGGSPYLTNVVAEVWVDERAVLDTYRIQQEGSAGYHVALHYVQQAAGSDYSAGAINYGAALARNDVYVLLDGERAEATLNGLSFVDGERHVDNHTAIDHAKANCDSHELYKAILDDRSRSVFNGKIYVRPNAQKTDAKQTNRNLLLSNDATVDTKPQLEIFADDVKCTHGATVGQLSDEEIFYLRSRGMSEETARQLLTYGFANDIVHRIKPQPVRAHLEELMTAALHTPPEIEVE